MLVRAALAVSTLIVLLAGCVSVPQRPSDLTELGVADAAALIRAKQVTSVELTQAYLARAEANRDLNAFITLNRAAALEAARRADAELAAGTAKGVLHGVPLVVKDNVHVAGLPNTAGTPALRDFIPKEHAPTVKRLLDAGAVVLGKTNMHELAFGISGYNEAFFTAQPIGTRNPYDRTRIAGGSSSGTGAAIAARLAPGGLGSDTGGSVRIPAGLTGGAGLRPTLGRYGQDGGAGGGGDREQGREGNLRDARRAAQAPRAQRCRRRRADLPRRHVDGAPGAAQAFRRHVREVRDRGVAGADDADGRRRTGPGGLELGDVPALHPQHRPVEQRRSSRSDDSRGTRTDDRAAGRPLARWTAGHRRAAARDRDGHRAGTRAHAAAAAALKRSARSRAALAALGVSDGRARRRAACVIALDRSCRSGRRRTARSERRGARRRRFAAPR